MSERNYKREYATYHSKPEQKKNRAKRNNARRKLEREGSVSKGDGKDVDHSKALRSGGSNTRKNLRVRSKSANRADNGGAGGRPKGGRKKLPNKK